MTDYNKPNERNDVGEDAQDAPSVSPGEKGVDPDAPPADASVSHDAETLRRDHAPGDQGVDAIANVETEILTSHDQTGFPEIEGYKVKRRLQSGGMGDIFLAQQTNPARRVAIKVIRDHRGAPIRQSLLARFKYEAEIQARLGHPNIARVYQAGTYEDHGRMYPYFAMEYVSGARSLTDYAEENHLSTRRRLELFRDLCSAIGLAHHRGVIHRDIKPSNVLVDAEGQVKVIDFGVSRPADPDSSLTSVETHVAKWIGTLKYMSPEQTQGDPERIDVRSDVYSLGILLYELLTGELPYDVAGAKPEKVATTIREVAPERLSRYNKMLRGDVQRIVSRALRKDPELRYSNASELARDIDAFLNDQPIMPSQANVLYLVNKAVTYGIRRHDSLAATLAIIIATLFAMTFGVAIVYTWTDLHVWFRSAVAAMAPAVSADESFEHVQIIEMSPTYDDEVVAMAQKFGIDAYDPMEPKSNRLMHAELVPMLVDAGAKVIAFDLEFLGGYEGSDLHAAPLGEAIRDATERQVPVLVTSADWPDYEKGELPIVAPLDPYVRAGPANAWFGDTTQWSIDAHVMFEPTYGAHHFASAIIREYMRPAGAPFDQTTMTDGPNEIVISYFKEGTSAGDRVIVKTERVPLSGIVIQDFEPTEFAPPRGTHVGYMDFRLHDLGVIRDATTSYMDVLNMTPKDRTDRFKGKIVMIADNRFSDTDVFPHMDYDEPIPGAFGLSSVIERTMANDLIRAESAASSNWLVILPLTIFGAIVTMNTRGRYLLRFVLCAGGVVIVAGLSILVFRSTQTWLDPVRPTIGLIVVVLLVGGINSIKQSSLT